MVKWQNTAKRLVLAAVLASTTLPSTGCAMAYWFTKDVLIFSHFWGTTPLIPVTPYFSQQIEDTYWEEERYKKVPILDPIEGENAPLFCLDPPRYFTKIPSPTITKSSVWASSQGVNEKAETPIYFNF